MQIFLSILANCFIGLICAYFAKKRGRSPLHWFLAGAFFGICGLVALFLFPRVKVVEGVKKVEPERVLQAAIQSQGDKLWYYLDHERQQLGPMSFDAMRKAWGEGKLHARTFVWNEELDVWKPFEEVTTYK